MDYNCHKWRENVKIKELLATHLGKALTCGSVTFMPNLIECHEAIQRGNTISRIESY